MSGSQSAQAVAAVRRWVDRFVVGMNLCPFAHRELVNERVRFVSSEAGEEALLLADLQLELQRLDEDDGIETTLLVLSRGLPGFDEFNQFLDLVDGLIEQMGWSGVYQVASFHPDYRFAGTTADDVENYTNRSPYPVLHLIREQSLERAIASHPDVDGIPLRNIALMNEMGLEQVQVLWQACLAGPD